MDQSPFLFGRRQLRHEVFGEPIERRQARTLATTFPKLWLPLLPLKYSRLSESTCLSGGRRPRNPWSALVTGTPHAVISFMVRRYIISDKMQAPVCETRPKLPGLAVPTITPGHWDKAPLDFYVMHPSFSAKCGLDQCGEGPPRS